MANERKYTDRVHKYKELRERYLQGTDQERDALRSELVSLHEELQAMNFNTCMNINPDIGNYYGKRTKPHTLHPKK